MRGRVLSQSSSYPGFSLSCIGLDYGEKNGENMARLNDEAVPRNSAVVARLTARIWRENTSTNSLTGLDLPGMQRRLPHCSRECDCARACYSARCGDTGLPH